MGIHRKKIEGKKCSCGSDMYEVSMKNPYIDDAMEECDNNSENCDMGHRAIPTLNSWARSQARREHE